MRKSLIIVLLAGGIVAFGVGAAQGALADPNLVGYWQFEHAGAQRYTGAWDDDAEPDYSDYNHYLMPYTGNYGDRDPCYASGIVGLGSDLDYNRASQFGEYWQVDVDIPRLRITDSITMMAWFYARSSANQYLLGTNVGSDPSRSYMIYTDTSGRAGMFLDSDGTGTDTVRVRSADNSVTMDAWNLLICTYDGASADLYLAEASQGSVGAADASLPYSSGINAGTAPFRIGVAPDWGMTTNTVVDEVAVWDRALSQSEIEDIFAAGKAGQTIPEPISLLLLAAGSGVLLRRRVK